MHWFMRYDYLFEATQKLLKRYGFKLMRNLAYMNRLNKYIKRNGFTIGVTSKEVSLFYKSKVIDTESYTKNYLKK